MPPDWKTFTASIDAEFAPLLGATVTDLAMIAGATLVALLVLNRLAGRIGLVDRPDQYLKRHRQPVPLTGGFAILAGLVMGTWVMAGNVSDWILVGLLGLVALIHGIDDLMGLPAALRLRADAVIALALAILVSGGIESMGQFGDWSLALGWFAVPMAVLSYLTLSNAFNMMDGVDGLMFGQFLVAALGLVAWLAMHGEIGLANPTLVASLVACGVVGLANFGALGARMKCFAGDAGARSLGFLMVFMLIAPGAEIISQIEGVYLVALPLMDITAVTLERLRLGLSPARGDRRHVHHLLLDLGLSPVQVTALIVTASAGFVFLLLAQSLAAWPQEAGLALFLALSVAYVRWRRPITRAIAKRLAPRQVIHPAE